MRREGKSALKGFLLCSGATFVAFIVCCVIAKLAFPDYPCSDLSRLSQLQDGRWKVVSDYIKPN